MSPFQMLQLVGAVALPPSSSQTSAGLKKAQPRSGLVGDQLTGGFDSLHRIRAEAQVVPEAANCVQCGMCSYNCPMGIDVRAHAWRGRPIHDSHCLACSECVKRCPRGVLRFERIPVFSAE